MSLLHEFVVPQKSGVVKFSNDLSEKLELDRPGVQIEITETSDGRFELTSTVPVPINQTWFWTERWQEMEREADSDIAAGRVTSSASGEDFLEQLEALTR